MANVEVFSFDIRHFTFVIHYFCISVLYFNICFQVPGSRVGIKKEPCANHGLSRNCML